MTERALPQPCSPSACEPQDAAFAESCSALEAARSDLSHKVLLEQEALAKLSVEEAEYVEKFPDQAVTPSFSGPNHDPDEIEPGVSAAAHCDWLREFLKLRLAWKYAEVRISTRPSSGC